MKKYLLGAAFIGVLAMTATGASAAVVCNDEGDCWKVRPAAGRLASHALPAMRGARDHLAPEAASSD